MATQIEIYNQALGFITTERLHPTTGLTEARKDRYELDAVYAKSIQMILEKGLWKFALRTSQLDADPNYDANFGLPYAFAIPDDFVRLSAFCVDSYLQVESPSFVEENGVWYDADPVRYVRYVSNGVTFGLDLGLWPENFCVAVAAEMAHRSSIPITKDRTTKADIRRERDAALLEARRLDMIDERVKTKAPGSWTSSRGQTLRPSISNGRMRF